MSERLRIKLTTLDDLTKSLNDLTESLNDLTESLNDLTESLKDLTLVIAMASIFIPAQTQMVGKMPTVISAASPFLVKWPKPDGYDGHESNYAARRKVNRHRVINEPEVTP